MFIACEELRNMAKSCRCRLHESDDFDSIIEEYRDYIIRTPELLRIKYILSLSLKKQKLYTTLYQVKLPRQYPGVLKISETL